MKFSKETPLEKIISCASQLYYQLVLVVGPPGSGKSKYLSEIAREKNFTIFNLNLSLSSNLLDLSPNQRKIYVDPVLSREVSSYSELLLIDNAEILFDRSLQQNPIKVLQNLSRSRVVFCSWGGSYENGVLSYAEPGHPEWLSHSDFDGLIVSV